MSKPSLKILVVDGDPVITDLYERWLGRYGHEVTTSNTIENTIQFAEQGGPFDGVLMSYNVVGGITTEGIIQRLRERFPTMPIVMTSAVHSMEQKKVGGPCCFIAAKPHTLPKLEEIMNIFRLYNESHVQSA
jgi:CheY-like chemotaxis protein